MRAGCRLTPVTHPRVLMVATALLLAVPSAAAAHEERPTKFPSGKGEVPHYRTGGPSLVVCKSNSDDLVAKMPPSVVQRNRPLLERCKRRGYSSLQEAIDDVRRRGTRILVLPGRYHEEETLRRPLPKSCEELKDETILSYNEQRKCPTLQNIVTIFGDGPDKGIKCDGRLCNLQIEGTGSRPEDVIFDGRFKRLNVIRADRADGVYFRNLTVQHAPFNGLYILQTDGFVIDRMVARWTDEYGFLTFADDHGLYKNCEAYGNGDGGLYPGSAAPHHGGRPSIEITRCRSHHNTLGYSGTAGNSTYVHHNRFYKNITGAAMDSLFPNHPGLPQNSATFVHNRIYSNNQYYYRYWDNGTCDKPSAKRGYEKGVVCPVVQLPVGTGVIVAGGNANLFSRNHIYDNWRYGAIQFWVPAALRGDEEPNEQYDTSHFNRYIGNKMGISSAGESLPNGLDFWWDEEGAGNCWQENVGGEDGISSDPSELPVCDQTPIFSPGNTSKTASIAPCAAWTPENNHPPGCDWISKPERPEDG